MSAQTKAALEEAIQAHIADESHSWMQLCVPCANRRLNNPLNALLGMRKIGDTDA